MNTNDALLFLRERIEALERQAAHYERRIGELGETVTVWENRAKAAEAELTKERQRRQSLEQRVNELVAERQAINAQLTEARKQPVKVLPEITALIIEDYQAHLDGYVGSYNDWDGHRAEVLTAVLRRHFRQAEAQPPDFIAALVARVQAETRRGCAEMVRKWWWLYLDTNITEGAYGLADRMERGE